jgi:uncharacterized DUF497 family protein
MKQFFEWHEAKAKSNYANHGIRFEKATESFDDPYLVLLKDSFEDGEVRWRIIGATRDSLLLFVVYTIRVKDGQEIIRIISARRVTKKERRKYEHG